MLSVIKKRITCGKEIRCPMKHSPENVLNYGDLLPYCPLVFRFSFCAFNYRDEQCIRNKGEYMAVTMVLLYVS